MWRDIFHACVGVSEQWAYFHLRLSRDVGQRSHFHLGFRLSRDVEQRVG
jgi:hypothetical protein